MRVVIQRTLNCKVKIENKIHSEIQSGLFILVGIETADTNEDADWLCSKITNLRIFNDTEGVMNLSVIDAKKEILVVSQFTLHASTKKGNRPSYIKAAPPVTAIPLYEYFKVKLAELTNLKIQSGVFAADMQIVFTNDGPVTILMDSKNKE